MGWFEIIFLAVIAPPALWVCIDFYILETLRDAKRDREES